MLKQLTMKALKQWSRTRIPPKSRQLDPDLLRVLDFIQPTISPKDNRHLCGPVMDEEITNAIKSLAHNKAPGPDGLTAEFYQTMWP